MKDDAQTTWTLYSGHTASVKRCKQTFPGSIQIVHIGLRKLGRYQYPRPCRITKTMEGVHQLTFTIVFVCVVKQIYFPSVHFIVHIGNLVNKNYTGLNECRKGQADLVIGNIYVEHKIYKQD